MKIRGKREMKRTTIMAVAVLGGALAVAPYTFAHGGMGMGNMMGTALAEPATGSAPTNAPNDSVERKSDPARPYRAHGYGPGMMRGYGYGPSMTWGCGYGTGAMHRY